MSRSRDASTLLRGVTAVAVLAVCSTWGMLWIQRHQHNGQCREQLIRLYRGLEQYELDRGALPSLAYYPTDPLESHDSLRKMLERFGVADTDTVCPAAPRSLRETGQTYLWNTALNGQAMPARTNAVWMLVDLQALDPRLPVPHGGQYHVLYSDGTVRMTMDPRNTLPGL